MIFICGLRQKTVCGKTFQTFPGLMRHIRYNHQTPLGKGRRSALGKMRDPKTGKWVDKP